MEYCKKRRVVSQVHIKHIKCRKNAQEITKFYLYSQTTQEIFFGSQAYASITVFPFS